jgi:hypothetical protein
MSYLYGLIYSNDRWDSRAAAHEIDKLLGIHQIERLDWVPGLSKYLPA